MPVTEGRDAQHISPGDAVWVGVAENVDNQETTLRVAVVKGKVSTEVRDPRAQSNSQLNVRLVGEDQLHDEVHVVGVGAVWLSPDAFSMEDLWELTREGALPRVSFGKSWVYALEPSVLLAVGQDEVPKDDLEEKNPSVCVGRPSARRIPPPPLNPANKSTPTRATKIPAEVEKRLLLSSSKGASEALQEAGPTTANSNPNAMEDFAFYQSLASVFSDEPGPSLHVDGMEQTMKLAAEGVLPDMIVSRPLPHLSSETTPVLLEEDIDRHMLDRYLGEAPRPPSECCTEPVDLDQKDITGDESKYNPPDAKQSTQSRIRGRASPTEQRGEKRPRFHDDPDFRSNPHVTHTGPDDGEDHTIDTTCNDQRMGAEGAEEAVDEKLDWARIFDRSPGLRALRDEVWKQGAQLVEDTSDSTGISSLQDPDARLDGEPCTALAIYDGGFENPASESMHGEEPSCSIWRSIPNSIYREHPVLDQESMQRFDHCRREFESCFERSIREEARRVGACKSKRLCPRPDLRAMQKMSTAARVGEEMGRGLVGSLNPEICFGHVPGLRVGDKFQSRAEMTVLGIHNSHMSGIDYISEARAGKGKSVVVAICQSGCYEDGKDGRRVMWYAGQGGNDLLGTCRQEKAQKLVRGNLALSNNRKFGGPPVRVFKKNQGCFVFDGLWMVEDMRESLGLSGKKVFEFCLRRLPGQGNSHATTVKFAGTPVRRKSSKSEPGRGNSKSMKHSTLTPKRGRPRKKTSKRNGPNTKRQSRGVSEDPVLRRRSGDMELMDSVIWKDISRGLEVQPISVVNSNDSFLPPGLSMYSFLLEHPEMKGARDWVTCQGFEYGVEFRYCEGVTIPSSPDFASPSDPHSLIHSFNQGKLVYVNGPRKLPLLLKQGSIIYECGPWCHCPQGKGCLQAASQRPLCWNLQVFKTSDRGWGIRTLDALPQGAFIGAFIGEILDSDAMSKSEDRYSMKLGKIQDLSTGRSKGMIGHKEEYYVSAKRYGNYCRFLNHSCDPNLFVQPVLSDHLDIALPKMCFFTSRSVEPGEELTYKYAGDSLNQVLDSGCFCTVCKRMAIVPVKLPM